MAFIDKKFLEEKDNEINNILNQVIDTNNENNTEIKKDNITTNTELEVNKKNREEYEKLMEESSTKLDSYYDKNNIFIKIILISLLIFIVLGCAYYIFLFISR